MDSGLPDCPQRSIANTVARLVVGAAQPGLIIEFVGNVNALIERGVELPTAALVDVGKSVGNAITWGQGALDDLFGQLGTLIEDAYQRRKGMTAEQPSSPNRQAGGCRPGGFQGTREMRRYWIVGIGLCGMLMAPAAWAVLVLRIGDGLVIGGQIEKGDAAKVRAQEPAKAKRIRLSGPGGLMVEALAIAKELHPSRTSGTILLSRDGCFSACASLLAANGRVTLDGAKGGFLAFHGGSNGALLKAAALMRARSQEISQQGDEISRRAIAEYVQKADRLVADLEAYYSSVGLNVKAMMATGEIGVGEVISISVKSRPETGDSAVRMEFSQPVGCLWVVPDAEGLKELGFQATNIKIDKEDIAKRLGVEVGQVCWTSAPSREAKTE